jgi:hypothetical protein
VNDRYQYLSIKYTERLSDAGIEPSVGSVGDSYDNALAETVIGLFKTEVIHRRRPWRSFEAVEFATLEWVDWFNNRRLLEPIGDIPPVLRLVVVGGPGSGAVQVVEPGAVAEYAAVAAHAVAGVVVGAAVLDTRLPGGEAVAAGGAPAVVAPGDDTGGHGYDVAGAPIDKMA